MPSTTNEVGALTLPVPAGTINTDLDDPFVSGLAAYLRHWLRESLNTKLANQQGIPEAVDACPSANVFKFNPGTYWVRNPVPALYVWTEGRSKVMPHSLVYDRRERTVVAMYIFPELVAPDGLTPRHGLLSAVDATFAKASDRQRHPTFGYNGAALGTTLARSLASAGLVGWQYDGGEYGFTAPIPVSDARSGGDEGYVQRGFPTLKGHFTVWEVVTADTLVIPDDVLGDITLTLNGSDGETSETTEIMQRILEAPDGAEP